MLSWTSIMHGEIGRQLSFPEPAYFGDDSKSLYSASFFVKLSTDPQLCRAFATSERKSPLDTSL